MVALWFSRVGAGTPLGETNGAVAGAGAVNLVPRLLGLRAGRACSALK
jgi:hypothetical protein